jgi:hypothetical protein
MKSINEMAHTLLKQQDEIIDLFCKTFFVSMQPKSAEELQELFEMCELEITTHSYFRQTIRIKLKNEYDALQKMSK